MDTSHSVDTGLEEHLAALKTVRSAKRCFALLAGSALLMHVGVFAAGRFTGVFELPSGTPATTVPMTQPTNPDNSAGPSQNASPGSIVPIDADDARRVARIVLPIAQLAGTGCAVLLCLTMVLAIGVSLAGRLGGARSMIIGFFQSVMLLLLICPWEQWLRMEGVPVYGAFYSWPELDAFLTSARQVPEQGVGVWIRFLALPGGALAMLVAVSLRFRRGFLFALERVDPELRARVL